MYKLIDKIDNVSSYKIFNTNIAYKDNKGLKEKSLYLNSVKLNPVGVTGFTFFQDFLFFSNWSNEVFKINIHNKSLQKLNDYQQVSEVSNEKHLILKKNIENSIIFIDNNKFNIENKWINLKSYIFNHHLYTSCINNRICKIDLAHPEQPIWHFDLNQFGTYRKVTDDLAYKVVQFIGIWQGKLLVQLTNARLIALDINTGELLYDIEINKTNPLTRAYYDAYIKMHLVDDKILWLTNQTLLHIDLNTFTPVVVKEYYSLPKERQWRFMHNTYHKDKIFFTADYAWQYVTPSYVGVMDAQTGAVLWSQQLEKTGGLPEAPKVTDDKLYIRTNNKVLHIFEKTQNETV